MNVNEIQFKLTIGAAGEIADFCPDKDLSQIDKIMSTYPDTIKNGARFIRALNRGYVMSENAKEPRKGSGLKVISEEEILSLEPDEFMALLERAMSSFGTDKETTIEAEPKKEEAPEKEAR